MSFAGASPKIELALTAIIRKDFKQASHYVRKSYERFLSKWSNLHPLSEKPRLQELANLQQVRHSRFLLLHIGIIVSVRIYDILFWKRLHYLLLDYRDGRVFGQYGRSFASGANRPLGIIAHAVGASLSWQNHRHHDYLEQHCRRPQAYGPAIGRGSPGKRT